MEHLRDPPVDRAAFEAEMMRAVDELASGGADDEERRGRAEPPEYASLAAATTRVAGAMRYVLGSGGKRFRAAVAFAASPSWP